MESPRFLNRWALTLLEKQGKTRQPKRTKTAKYFIQDLLFGTKTKGTDKNNRFLEVPLIL
jgi:hypothetical protein